MVGYLGQYEFAAIRTLEALRGGTLESVRVADVSAGQIDDFQLRSIDRLDAHQVKWSLHPGTIGYAEFVNDAVGRTRFIRQLADGWERLRARDRGHPVVVHFVTNDIASSGPSATIPRPDAGDRTDGNPRTWSFAAFLAEAWHPARNAARAGGDPTGAVPAAWAPAMAAFAEASRLDPGEWPSFIVACELEFGVPNLEAVVAAAPVAEAERIALRNDADRLAHAYMRLVARPDRRIEFTRDQLLDELGWRYRAEFKHAHEFPDPEIPYRTIRDTAREFTDAIDAYTTGYIAVTGSPGSGKSTLLTRILRERPDRVVRYYAYVRGAAGGNARRGEAVNFFHDLTVAFDRAGLYAGSTLPTDDLDLLARRVLSQLERAHREWEAGGPRTIILVDGLDHIPREQQPAQSLLAHLPHPEDVPDGVLVVLGTQTDRLPLLSARIREQLDERGRRITMRRLDRLDVLEIVEAAADLDPAPAPDERERIYRLSGGHPLALNYVVNRLRLARGVPVATTLDAVEPFRNGIDQQYATIWATVEGDVQLARFLALLARTRGPVRLDWVRRWAPPQALHTVTTGLAYLFRLERNSHWAFFHNSFRAFLVERSRGLPALGGDPDLYAELAAHSEAANIDEPERADELYYRSREGDTGRVLALADPTALRAQFVAGRPASAISDDLALALDAAVQHRDIIALTRVLLGSAEFAQREHYSGLMPLAEVWIELGDLDLALAAVKDGAFLRASRGEALRTAAALDARGLSAEAREVFLLAEPFDLLYGTAESTGRPQDHIDLMDEWIAVAPRFRSLSELIGMVRRVRASAGDIWHHPDHNSTAAIAEETEARQLRLLGGLARALDALDRWSDADLAREALRERDASGGWWFRAQVDAWRWALGAGERRLAEHRFTGLRRPFQQGTIAEGDLGPHARAALAEGFIRVTGDAAEARRILESVEQPALVSDASSTGEDGWRPFHRRFALNRVLGALGDNRSLHEIVPDIRPGVGDPPSQWDEGTALLAKFERGVAHLGRLAGRAWVGDFLAPSDFEAHARPLVELFPDHPQLVRGGYVALRGRDGFYTRLVRIAAAHGAGCVGVLRELFSRQWQLETRRDAWPDAVVRATLNAMIAVDADTAWVQAELARIEPMTFRGEDLETDLGDGVAQARTWIAAEDVVAARTTLRRVLSAAFGIEAKDDQLNACIGWAVRANHVDPGSAPDRLAQLAGAVVSLDGADAQRYVVPTLIEAGVNAGSQLARCIIEWVLRNGVDGWVDALTTFVDRLVQRTPSIAGVLSAFYRSLVLPFTRGADVDLIARLALALATARDQDELAALAEGIEVVALGSLRPPLREAFAQRTDDATALMRDGTVTDPTAPNQIVEAFEGLSLTLRELQARVESVADIEDLARRLKPNAYMYRWELILARFIARASADELVAAAAAIPQNDYAWKGLASIAERLVALGDSRAQAIAERVLLASRASSWSPRWDGGSRLVAYEMLVQISPDQWRERAWEGLRKDIAAGEIRPIDVFREWERIVPLLAPSAIAVDVWQVVSLYVAALVAYAPQGEPILLPPAEPSGAPSSVAETVYGFVATYLDHPAVALAQGAQRFFVDRMMSGDAPAEAALISRLSGPHSPKDGALLVLRAGARRGLVFSAGLDDALGALRHAANYRDRRTALALLQREDVGDVDRGLTTAMPATTIHRPLPPVFNLVHPPAPPRHRRPVPERGAILEPAVDAADLVSIFRPELDLIARWADVQPEALYRYVADRAAADHAATRQDYAIDAESALREDLHRVGLEVSYRRPRARGVERAMAEAVAMLLDHGRLDERHLPALDQLLRNADPFFVQERPRPRPSEVAPIAERAESQYVKPDWTAGVTPDPAATGRWMSARSAAAGSDPGDATSTLRPSIVDGNAGSLRVTASSTTNTWVVLAEESWLRWLDWKIATEMRVGARLPPEMWAGIDPDEEAEEAIDPDDTDGEIAAGQAIEAHVAEFWHLTADEYITHARSPNSLVVRNSAYRFETPAGRWLAINPALAEHVGWRPADDGLFRWLDAEGNLMAESVWWQDGFAQQRPPQFEDEVGHGWLVRVSAGGWEQLAAVVGPCVDWCRVSRLAVDQQPAVIVVWKPVPNPGDA